MSQGKSKRPICPSCSKPTRTCLCSRILTSPIPNSINVTILQHALECNHPLNSTRIAKMGLKNLTIATVSDVKFESQFLIHLFDSNLSKCLFSDEIEDAHDLFCDKDSNLIDIDSAGLENDVEDVIFNNSRVETVNQVNDDDGGVVVNDEVKKISIRRNGDDVTSGYGGPVPLLLLLPNMVQLHLCLIFGCRNVNLMS
ncbi:unnamed protein product [Trifolium pratense]|uniref:Uncharacterized protein n=2 Tax=Trifolium pratense TaxID=57577 RepID=A0ACB0ILK8_TRIPR|nr:unnamed protein product [Trifolium pratense]